ncbi:clp protease proteolytic subunit chloroplast [Cinnamomum micranthum f. kanehirae]|uniref:ATP-dependent Clp protease proteolytic subunit n=1 Tax=Cinnamomum micranthum f. kanehirae TaxID=337451 RepID=A0A3S3NEJ1_9MAGN|nr:clp protease proteolytic subunit chloroplast [Cinnamomum micranthum f. kanehirae]
MQFGLTYSVTCQTYWVIWDFPVLSPDRDILCFAQERLIEPSIIRSAKKEVDSEISNQLVGLMVYLSIEDDTRDLYLFINSPGGWVIPGIAIYDTMQFVPPDVHTICMGLAASMGSFILVGGEITKRLAFPHAWRQSTEAQDYGIVDLVAIENTGDFA